ncbi:hypothetical protein IX51_06780 [uncultured archaeon]|nr:hypothetical protein IX51_06780 [uncultured archaeon]
MKSSLFYAVVSLASYLMLFFFGIKLGLVYVDPILASQMYVPPIIIALLTVASIFLTVYREAEIYIIGVLITVYSLLFVATIPYFSLLPFSAVSLISSLAYFSRTVGFSRRTVSKLAAFIGVIFAMFILGSSLRMDTGPPSYAMAFGSIYDDVLPGGVPLMFTDGIVFYSRYFILSVSVPIVTLFTVLSVVLTENYYLIFKLLSFKGSGSVRKTVSNAVTVLSCQCEGITASFPSAIAAILFTAIIPLISESIVFLLLTDILLIKFYLKGKRVRLLDSIWKVTESGWFMFSMIISLIAVPVYSTYVVYLSLQSNLAVFSSVNILMFVYGIFVVYLVNRVLPVKRKMPVVLTYLLVALSSIGMFIWYVPQITLPTVNSSLVFSVMGVVSVASGILSGMVFKGNENEVRMLYLEFITMMFSMLAIVVFYISAIGLTVIWPEFGMGQQLQFSLLLWGFTLPVMWLSTNISLNADRFTRNKIPVNAFLFTNTSETTD